MAQAYDTNQVLVRRGCGLLLNPYSPKGTSNDGIITNSDNPSDITYPSYQDVAKWGQSTQYNKEQFVSDATGSIYENAEPNYIHRIKIGHSYGYGERHPYVFFRLKNRSIVKSSAGCASSSPDSPGFFLEGVNKDYNGLESLGHNLFDQGGPHNNRIYGKSSFITDYNPQAPLSGSFYDSKTIQALNGNPDWYSFKPIAKGKVVQCISATPPSLPNNPSGYSTWWSQEFTISYTPAYKIGNYYYGGFIYNFGNLIKQNEIGNYDGGNPDYIKYANANSASGMTQITSNTLYNGNSIQRPTWYLESGQTWTSSDIPYDVEFPLFEGKNFPDIMLRYANDGQSEYDISANDIITSQTRFTKGYNVSTPTDYNGGYTAFRTPANDTPYLMRNQIMKFDLRSDLISGCPDACWLKDKVIKIKLKYQLGEISIYKNAGELPQSGNTNIIVKINYNWTTYEEETVDNIDIKFDQQDSNPYGILWSKEIECQPGQAKRLVDICVLEVRDKT